MNSTNFPSHPVGNHRKSWCLLAVIGCCAGLGCNSSVSSPGASLRTVTFPSASSQQWVKQSSVGTSPSGTAVNDFTTNISLSSQGSNITALGRAVPNPLPENNAPPIQEQEFLASFDASGNSVGSTPIGQGVLVTTATLATGTPDGNYAAASNPATVANSPTLLPLNVEKFSSTGATIWTATLPTTSQFIQFRPNAIVADASGDIYVAGSVNGPTDGLWGVFFAKFDGNSGSLVWQDEYPSIDDGMVNNLAADANGNLYVVGIGNGKFTSSSNGTSSFLAKLDSGTGKTIWSLPAPSGISFMGAAVNSAGNGYIVGKFGTKQRIGYLAGFSTQSGALTWQEQFGGGTLLPSNVSVDASGDAIFVGGVSGASNSTAQDLFVAKIDTGGQPVWMQKFGAGQEDRSADSEAPLSPYVVTDGQSNIYVAGITAGAFPGFQNPSGLGEAFVAKFAAQ
ncbi:MAG: hypothetical protein WCE63_09570 [Acidobacteriaceae bacterium]